jgi:hypothetical protein
MKAARAAFVFLFWIAGTAAAKDTWIVVAKTGSP